MVGPYPPLRDGIASYAVQTVQQLRSQGHDVEVLSPGPSAAHHHLALLGPRGGLALAKRVRAYDKVVVQFHPDFFYPVPATTRQRVAVSAAYAAAFAAARSSQVVVHEVDYRLGRGPGPAAKAMRAMFARVDELVVHTESERAQLVSGFGVPTARVSVVEHGENFQRRTTFGRAAARRSLGLDPDEKVFVSLGFIQPHKGFHRAVEAFRGLDQHRASYHVVGSLRVEDQAYVDYLERLRTLVEEAPGTHLHTGYVSDELFDRWIVACDVVVLPYEQIWSSGVLERAHLYRRPVIATNVGGLAEQVGDRDDCVLVDDDAGLRAAMWSAAGLLPRGPEQRAWAEPGPDLRARVQGQVQLRATIARGGPRPPVTEAGESAPPRAAASTIRRAVEASAPLRRVSPVRLPETSSARPLARIVKRLVRRATAWQLEPVVHEMNALREAAISSVERAASVPREEAQHRDGTPAPSRRSSAGDSTG